MRGRSLPAQRMWKDGRPSILVRTSGTTSAMASQIDSSITDCTLGAMPKAPPGSASASCPKPNIDAISQSKCGALLLHIINSPADPHRHRLAISYLVARQDKRAGPQCPRPVKSSYKPAVLLIRISKRTGDAPFFRPKNCPCGIRRIKEQNMTLPGNLNQQTHGSDSFLMKNAK